MHGRCLIVLSHHGITRLITVILLVHFALLLGLGIAVTRIFSLVDRQRCRCRSGTAIPVVPTSPMLLPIVTPVITPARRRFSAPWCLATSKS